MGYTPAARGAEMLTSSIGLDWVAVLIVNWVGQAIGCDTKK
jgi:hypothetical protein